MLFRTTPKAYGLALAPSGPCAHKPPAMRTRPERSWTATGMRVPAMKPGRCKLGGKRASPTPPNKRAKPESDLGGSLTNHFMSVPTI
eukprot:scaffold1295_cov220-Pinguiococcus_pyrenoidosus.AAC.4